MAIDHAGVKERFIQHTGYWDAECEALLALDPEYFQIVVNLVTAPSATGALEPKIAALVQLAFDVSITHYDKDGAARHIARAMASGATREEVLEVCQLTSVVGIHACNMGVPILAEELQALNRGHELGPAEFDERRETLKAKFVELRGYWSPLWDDLLRNSPEFFEAYTQFSSYPWLKGGLPPKVKEFIYIAIDAATHHLYLPGLRIHIQNALRHGATASEIMELLMLISAAGVKSSLVGAQALVAHAEKTSQRKQ